MSSQAYSSIGAGKRRGTAHDEIDRSFYTVGQTLASIVNDPRASSQSGGFWGLSSEVAQLPQLPPLDPTKYPPVSKADLQRYIDLVHGAYERFLRDRQSLEAFDAQHQGRRSSDRHSSSSSGQQQGEPFMVAMQAVPAQFFQEGFFDNWDDFFKQYCKEQSAEELYEQIDLLNRNLDVVEMQLLREVAGRSSSFFQAAATLQLLQGQLSEAVGCIRGLRQELSAADRDMYSTAAAVKGLQARRDNLQDTLDITKGLDEVVASQQALEVMLEGQDYAAALDLLDQLKSLLQQPQLMGLQCLRHLPPKLMDVAAAVDAALSNELLANLANPDLAQLAAQAAADAEAQPDASIAPDGSQPGSSTWHLPDPASFSSAAAEEQLQESLLPLTVGLYRSESLAAALQQYKTNAGEEVKGAVRDVVQQVLPVLLAACGDSLPQQQEGGGASGEVYAWEQLQLLHHGAFMVLLYAAARVIFSCIHHTVRVGKLLERILRSIQAPHSQCGSVLKACGVAVQVAADVGMGRWVKLLNARSTAHTRLKQYELKQILDLSEQVADYIEAVGARPLSSFRMALQGQCKALLDSNHNRCMTQLQGLLEAEQWVAVDVPDGFQTIVDRLLVRCAEGAALLEGREVGTPNHKRSSSSGGGSRGKGRSSAAGDMPSPSPSPATPSAPAAAEDHQAVLHLCGKSFHLVNSALMLLKMVDEYMSLHDLMPQFGAEIVHRQLELMKLFNSQTAALVLGAGAMRTAGLRSISAKQLALSCQAIAMLSTLLQPLRAGCLAMISQPRRALLMPEYDRLLQDLTMHVDEVHSKLVDIMRDRLAAAMQALPAETRAAAPGSGSTSVSAPTPTIALLTKQLATLRAVLVPLLLREEVEFVFGAVSRSYSDALSDTFETLLSEPNSGWEQVVQINALTMLEAFRELPLDPARSNNYSARLTTTYTKHFGLPPWDQQRLGHKLQQQQQQQQHQEQPAVESSSSKQQEQPSEQREQQQVVAGEQQQLKDLQQQQQQHGVMAAGAVVAAAAAAAGAAAAVGRAGSTELLVATNGLLPDAAVAATSVDAAAATDAVEPPGSDVPSSTHTEPQHHSAVPEQQQESGQQMEEDRQQQQQMPVMPSAHQQQQVVEQQQQVQLLQQLPLLPQDHQPLSGQQQQPVVRDQLDQQQLLEQAEHQQVLEQPQQHPDTALPFEAGVSDHHSPFTAAALSGAAAGEAAAPTDHMLVVSSAAAEGDQQQQHQQQEEQQQTLPAAVVPKQQLVEEGDLVQEASEPSSILGTTSQQVPHTAGVDDAPPPPAGDLMMQPDLLGGIMQSEAADQVTYMQEPPAFMDQPPAFMDAPPAFMDAPPTFMDAPPAAAPASAADGVGPSAVVTAELDLLGSPVATGLTAANSSSYHGGGEAYTLPLPAADEVADESLSAAAPVEQQEEEEQVSGVAVGVSGVSLSPLDLLDAELQEGAGDGVVTGSASASAAAAAANYGAAPAAAASSDAAGLMHLDHLQQQEQEQQQQQQQELEQQQEQQHKPLADRPAPELYASLLLPDTWESGSGEDGGVDDTDSASQLQPLASLEQAAAAAGVGQVAAAGGSAGAAAPAAAPISSSNSWDPLGAATSAPPTQAVLEGLSTSSSLTHAHSRGLS